MVKVHGMVSSVDGCTSLARLSSGNIFMGCICLHGYVLPATDAWRHLGSIRCFTSVRGANLLPKDCIFSVCSVVPLVVPQVPKEFESFKYETAEAMEARKRVKNLGSTIRSKEKELKVGFAKRREQRVCNMLRTVGGVCSTDVCLIRRSV